VDSRCCYGGGPAKKCIIDSMIPSDALHYKLESFAECRATKWTFKPYRGTAVDGPMFGPPPPPWAIDVRFDRLFQDKVIKMEVPHTASVQMCFGCGGRGNVECCRCRGRRRIKCHHCNGHGHTSRQVREPDGRMVQRSEGCFVCHRKGRVPCPRCNGHGRVTCTVCQGAASLLHFIELTVEFKTHVKEHVVEEMNLVGGLIKDAGGTTVLEDTNVRVAPVAMNQGTWAKVSSMSQQLLAQHGSELACFRVWQQRQTVRSVPVCDVSYQYKGKVHRFVVFGLDKRVWFDNYPADCCWGCALL